MGSLILLILLLLLSFQNSRSTEWKPNFICDDGTIILQNRFCSNFADCPDKSDERKPEIVSDETNLTSEYLICSLPRSLGWIEACAIRRVEFCRGHTQCIGKTLCDGWCPDFYRCPDGSCRQRASLCDDEFCNDCPSSRRFDNGHGFKCLRNGRLCNLPQNVLFDGISDCDDGTDLCYVQSGSNLNGDPRDVRNRTGSSFNYTICFACRDEQHTIVSSSNVCDGKVDCPNLKDECQCEKEAQGICGYVSKYEEHPTMIMKCDCFDSKGICHNILTLNKTTCAQTSPPACHLSNSCNQDFPCDMLCSSHFRCPDMTCLPRSTVCDGDMCNDCSSSQRWNNGHGCKCARNGGSCVLPQILLFDGIADCDDAIDLCYVNQDNSTVLLGNPSDVRQSIFAEFNNSACFRCHDNETIISSKSVCDDVIDCPDLSDECSCGGKTPDLCRHATSYASNPSLVRTCECFDDSNTCLNHLNPDDPNMNCNKTKRQLCDSLVHPCNPGVPCDMECPTHFRCPDSTCLHRSTICDDDTCNDCSSHLRWQNGHGFKCTRKGRDCNLLQMFLWDGVKDCDAGSDLCFLDNEGLLTDNPNDIRSSMWAQFNHSLCFHCLDNDLIIPKTSVCDDVIDCYDMSDECLCEGQLPDLCAKLQPHVISQQSVSRCNGGKFDCGSGICVDTRQVCDGNMDCDDGSDELSNLCSGTAPCGNQTVPGKLCRCSHLASETCEQKTAIFCDGRSECVISSGSRRDYNSPAEDECTEVCEKFTRNSSKPEIKTGCRDEHRVPLFECSDYHVRPKLCNGLIECNHAYFNDVYVYHDEDPTICTSKFACNTVEGYVSIDQLKVCDGFVDCVDGSDENGELCPGRIHCQSLGGAALSIGKHQICDGQINCDSSEDELGCSDDGRFYCESGKPLFVPKKLKFNGVGDCSDWSDECPSVTSSSGMSFSSRYELIANPLLRGAVWIMGLAATLGNMESIKMVMLKEIKPATQSRGSHASSRANHILVLNLSASDFLMGVYLIILGSMGVDYSGEYCSSDLSWRSSGTCVALGVMVALSSETSVLTMVLLTTFRLYAVFKPFQASSNPSTRIVMLSVFMTWFVSFFIALLPLTVEFEEKFQTKAWIEKNMFFRDVTVDFSDMKTFVKRVVEFYPDVNHTDVTSAWKQTNLATSWSDLYRVLIRGGYHILDKPKGYLGYYSSNSVCISRLFVTSSDEAWSYTMSIISFNFVAFLYVAFSYFLIYRKTTKRGRIVNHGQNARVSKKNKDMQNKIIILILTDFCSWIPLSLMTFLHFTGFTLPSVAYVVSAVILLPINSAINPLIYSTALDKLRKNVVHKVSSTLSRQPRTQSTAFQTAQV